MQASFIKYLTKPTCASKADYFNIQIYCIEAGKRKKIYFQLMPDVIYLMADGEYSDRSNWFQFTLFKGFTILHAYMLFVCVCARNIAHTFIILNEGNEIC